MCADCHQILHTEAPVHFRRRRRRLNPGMEHHPQPAEEQNTNPRDKQLAVPLRPRP